MHQVFEQICETLIEFNTQHNQRLGNTKSQQRISTHESEFRPQRSEIPPIDERDTTISEPPLSFYKQSTSMSINDEAQKESSNSNGSVPTTIKPFDGTDPGYTVEEYFKLKIL